MNPVEIISALDKAIQKLDGLRRLLHSQIPSGPAALTHEAVRGSMKEAKLALLDAARKLEGLN